MKESSATDYNSNEWCKEAVSLSKKNEVLVADEDPHSDQYNVEMDNLKKFGDNYLALQSIERSKNMGNKPAE